MDKYSKLTKGKETLAQAIDNEWGLDIITVKEYICPQLVALAKNKGVTGIYYGDYMKINDMKSLNKWIENAKTRIKIALDVNTAETTVVKKGSIVIPGPTEKTSPEQIYQNQRNKSIGQKLYKQINGVSNGQNTHDIITRRVNSQNVVTVMDEYKRLSNGKESLPQALSEEYSLDLHTEYTREGYVRYFYSRLTEYAQKHNVKIPKELAITTQNKDDLDKLVELTDKLHNYVKSKIQEPQNSSLKGYINELGYPRPNFEEQTGISFNQALLTNPTINKADKINAIRNSFTYYSRTAERYGSISVKDIIDDANSDLQALVADGDFKKYAPLYETTINRLQARVYRSKNEAPTNGRIDKDFQQGGVGDCWLLASIKALSMNPTPITDDDITDFNDPNTITCVSAHGNQKDIKITNKSDDSQGILTTGHAYTVVRADKNNVYLINPWDTSKEIPVDIRTFKAFFTSIDKFEL